MKNAIKKILIENPATRDNAIHLASVYYDTLIGDINLRTAAYLLRAMYKGEVPSMDTISRCSRLLQEKNPELRGKNWAKRQGKAEVIRTDVNQLFKTNNYAR